MCESWVTSHQQPHECVWGSENVAGQTGTFWLFKSLVWRPCVKIWWMSSFFFQAVGCSKLLYLSRMLKEFFVKHPEYLLVHRETGLKCWTFAWIQLVKWYVKWRMTIAFIKFCCWSQVAFGYLTFFTCFLKHEVESRRIPRYFAWETTWLVSGSHSWQLVVIWQEVCREEPLFHIKTTSLINKLVFVHLSHKFNDWLIQNEALKYQVLSHLNSSLRYWSELLPTQKKSFAMC